MGIPTSNPLSHTLPSDMAAKLAIKFNTTPIQVPFTRIDPLVHLRAKQICQCQKLFKK